MPSIEAHFIQQVKGASFVEVKLASMENPDLNTFVGRLLHAKKMREAELGRSIDDKDIAQAAHISPSAFSQWIKEKVNTENLKADPVIKVASYLKVRAEWLWEKKGPMRGDVIVESAATDDAGPRHWEHLAADERAAFQWLIDAVLAGIVALPNTKPRKKDDDEGPLGRLHS